MVGIGILAAAAISRIVALAKPFSAMTTQAPSKICRQRSSITGWEKLFDSAVRVERSGAGAGADCGSGAGTRPAFRSAKKSCVCVTSAICSSPRNMLARHTDIDRPIWSGIESARTIGPAPLRQKLVLDSMVAVAWPGRQIKHRAIAAGAIGERHDGAAVHDVGPRADRGLDLELRHHAVALGAQE